MRANLVLLCSLWDLASSFVVALFGTVQTQSQAFVLCLWGGSGREVRVRKRVGVCTNLC